MLEQAIPTAAEVIGNHAGSIRELGICTEVDGDGLAATIEVHPELFLPGTEVVRTSVLVTLADVVAGKFANASTAPHICVTLDLDLHLLTVPGGPGYEPGSLISARSSVVRAGRRIIVMGVEILDPSGSLLALGNAGFMASPDPAHLVSGGFPLDSLGERFHLTQPFAGRVGATRNGGGTARVPHNIDNSNATGAIQGGLLALVAEEALCDAVGPAVIESMAIRYLRAFRGTPAIARAHVDGRLGRVELVDADGRLGAIVTVHLSVP